MKTYDDVIDVLSSEAMSNYYSGSNQIFLSISQSVKLASFIYGVAEDTIYSDTKMVAFVKTGKNI